MTSFRNGENRRGTYRILALDVDGTLLDPDGNLRPRTVKAVSRAAEAGIRPVLCTGRRYRRARPISDQLGLATPMVCNSGAIVKEPVEHRTLWRADFQADLVSAVLDLFEAHDQPSVAFTDQAPDRDDFVIPAFPTGHVFFDEYVARNREHASIDPRWGDRLRTRGPGLKCEPLFHIFAVGSRVEMLAFEQVILNAIGPSVQTFVQRSPRYAGTMCEVLRADASKWTAVLHLAKLWGIEASEICAVGDDVNDVPMLRNAGLGVAMGHAPSDVLASADLVTGNHHEDGLAAFVEDVLLAG